MDVLEITWRVGNACLAFIAGALLLWSYSDRWARLPDHDRTIGVGMLLLVATVVVGAVEQIAHGTGTGVRTAVATVALGCLIAGLVAARKHGQRT